MIMKRTLILLIAVALAGAVAVGYQRLHLERENNTVELVAGFSDFSQFISPEFPAAALLSELRSLGIESIALTEWTLGEKIALGYDHAASASASGGDLVQLLAEPMGFNPDEIAAVSAAGMRIIPRLEKNQVLDISTADKLADLTPHIVIFNVGSAPNLPPDYDGNVGLVEFTSVSGIEQAVDADRLIRVHGISAKELENLEFDRILTRFVRAVRERNVRVLYLRPLTGVDGWEQTVTLIRSLTADLHAKGYKIGKAVPFSSWQTPHLHLWIVGLGIIAGALLLLQHWMTLEPEWIVVLLLISGIGSWFILSRAPVLGQQLLALTAAVVFPTLAVVRNHDDGSTIQLYLRTTAWSFIGLILIIGILSGTSFLVKLTEFRGVKLMHLAPVFLVFVTGYLRDRLPFRSWREFRQVVSELYQTSVPVKYLLMLAVVGAVGAVYILRTANFKLPIPQFEIGLREALEQFFTVRPRFKEIFIGHPALVLLLASKNRNPILMGLAVIGQLSLVNTFTHIHTPIIISAIRAVNGLVIGYAVGWVLWLVYQKGTKVSSG